MEGGREIQAECLARAAKGFQGPDVLGVFAAQDIALAIGEQDAEIGGARGIPAVFHLGDVDHLAAELHTNGALVGFVTGVALDVKKFSGQRVLRLWMLQQGRSLVAGGIVHVGRQV